MAKAKEEATDVKALEQELEQPIEAVVEAKPAKKTTKTTKKAATKKVVAEVETTPEAEVETEATEEKVVKAVKAGPKARRAAAEAAEATEVEEPAVEVATEKKGPKPNVRPLIERRSKQYREVAKQLEADKLYTLKEACELATKTSPVKFDATVEMHVRLGVDPRHADQNVRDTVILPAGTGKTLRIAVLAEPDLHAAAKKAGADIVGDEDLLEQIKKEELNFDVLVATPSSMPKLGRFAKLLGPKGLMPSPKNGTVTKDVAKAVEEAKAGRVEFRVDSTGIVHLGIGKVSFGGAKLLTNAEAVMTAVKNAKPTAVKGTYILSVTVTTSMGPGIAVSLG